MGGGELVYIPPVWGKDAKWWTFSQRPGEMRKAMVDVGKRERL